MLNPWPLMRNNISQEDLNRVAEFLRSQPVLTQSKKVEEFEEKWSQWVGVRYSIFLNSGSSANILTMAALRYLHGEGEVIVPTLTWVSDVTSVLYAGLKPVFVDIDLHHLGMAEELILKAISPWTKAVFLTYVLGFNSLSARLLNELKSRGILLIEDVCESHGATHAGKRLGSLGYISNFSFYYAHHMSTIEGGMVCTNSEEVYDLVRMLRSHGMLREAKSEVLKNSVKSAFPDLNPDFIFLHPGYNMRNTEVNAVIGLNQLKGLDRNNEKRRNNFRQFLKNLDGEKFYTQFREDGSCNYAFTLLLKNKDDDLKARVETRLKENGIEFRRGMSGGGNQVRQPYLRKFYGIQLDPSRFPNAEHVHFYGYYIGNYPDLEQERILELCSLLNEA